ncbi:hypothetical protein OnM2_000001 [Erysiphe neolycopersici]|uniref:Uncharacterized protein n=1 Tax=Erysiphe neolycopersici TaxID=212602 RepID=A0A420I8Q9_9PEZI|nr:hypothetical protein OnM2_000001 [Erysiphe neolycopersici]
MYYQSSGKVASVKTLQEQSIYSYESILNLPEGSPGPRDKKGKLMLINPFIKYKKGNWTSRNFGSPLQTDLQFALGQECTFHSSWPMRAASADWFRDDFSIVSDFIKAQQPTWPMVMEAVLQILHSNEYSNAALDAFARFRSGPSNDEKTLNFLKRMVNAYGRLPKMDRQSSEAANTIRFTLNTHVT